MVTKKKLHAYCGGNEIYILRSVHIAYHTHKTRIYFGFKVHRMLSYSDDLVEIENRKFDIRFLVYTIATLKKSK